MFVKKQEIRPEDMGHKNPPLHKLNMEARRIDATLRESAEGARELAIRVLTRAGSGRRVQKNLRGMTTAPAAGTPLERTHPDMLKD